MPGPLDTIYKAIEKPLHQTYLFEFRTEQCQLFLKHKCNKHRPYTCFYWHFMNQRRRRPVKNEDGSFNYHSDVYCMKYDEATGICSNGDSCPLLHRTSGDTERRYHLRYYKTENCVHETDNKGYCVKNGLHCAFAHGLNDLREPIFGSDEIGLNEFIHNAIPRELLIKSLIQTLKAQNITGKSSLLSLLDTKNVQNYQLDPASVDEGMISFDCLAEIISENQYTLSKLINNTRAIESNQNNHHHTVHNQDERENGKLVPEVEKLIQKFQHLEVNNVKRRLFNMLLMEEENLQSINPMPTANLKLKLNRLCPTLLLEKDRELQYEDPKWHDGSYVLIHYKTQSCDKPPRLCRQGYACPAYHNDKDKRRSPKIYKYRSTPCPNVKHGDEWGDPNSCENGNECPYCHTRTEQQFHPEIFKTTKCNDMMQTGYCPRGPFCAFAHIDQELCAERKLVCQLMLGLDASPPTTISPPPLSNEDGACRQLLHRQQTYLNKANLDGLKNLDTNFMFLEEAAHKISSVEQALPYRMVHENNLSHSFPHDGTNNYGALERKCLLTSDKLNGHPKHIYDHNPKLELMHKLALSHTQPHHNHQQLQHPSGNSANFRPLPPIGLHNSTLDQSLLPNSFNKKLPRVDVMGNHPSFPPLPLIPPSQAKYNKNYFANNFNDNYAAINYNHGNAGPTKLSSNVRVASSNQHQRPLNVNGPAVAPYYNFGNAGNARGCYVLNAPSTTTHHPYPPNFQPKFGDEVGSVDYDYPPNPVAPSMASLMAVSAANNARAYNNNQHSDDSLNATSPWLPPYQAPNAFNKVMPDDSYDNYCIPASTMPTTKMAIISEENGYSSGNGYYSPDLSTFLSLFPPGNEQAQHHPSTMGDARENETSAFYNVSGGGGDADESFRDLVNVSKKLWNGDCIMSIEPNVLVPTTATNVNEAIKLALTRSGSDPSTSVEFMVKGGGSKMSHSAPFSSLNSNNNLMVGGVGDQDNILNNLPLNLIKCHAEKIRKYLEKVEVALTQRQEATTTFKEDGQRLANMVVCCMVCKIKPPSHISIPCGHFLLCDSCASSKSCSPQPLFCIYCGIEVNEFRTFSNATPYIIDQPQPKLQQCNMAQAYGNCMDEQQQPSTSLLEGNS